MCSNNTSIKIVFYININIYIFTRFPHDPLLTSPVLNQILWIDLIGIEDHIHFGMLHIIHAAIVGVDRTPVIRFLEMLLSEGGLPNHHPRQKYYLGGFAGDASGFSAVQRQRIFAACAVFVRKRGMLCKIYT